MGRKKDNKKEKKGKTADSYPFVSICTVSYTHLTLPTNREV